MVGDKVDFENKTLIFLANLNQSICEEIAGRTNATLIAFNASIGYNDTNITRYWIYGGRDNLLNMVNYLLAKFFGDKASFDAPKVPENRSKMIFILDRDSKQIPS